VEGGYESGGWGRPFPLRLSMLPVGLLFLLLVLSLPALARAEDQSHIIQGVSCPTTSFCAAFQIGGTYLLTANPTADSSWRAMDITEENDGATGLSCPSAEFCAVVDSRGDVITSADPSSPVPSWRTAHVDIEPVSPGAGVALNGPGSIGIEGISCPSTTLCVAVDSDGNVITSTEPGGGAAAWRREDLDEANQFDAVTCAPGSTFCAAVDMEGRLFVSGDPAGGASTWRSAKLDAGATGSDYTDIFWGISCPTAGFCMASTSESRIFTSTEPANPASWRPTSGGPLTPPPFVPVAEVTARSTTAAHASDASSSVATDGENIMSCPSTSLCAIPGFSAYEIWTTEDPMDDAATWHGVHPPQFVVGGENDVTSVGCATAQLCVAGTWLGEGLVSEDPGGDASAWPARLAPATIPPAPDELPVTGVSLKGTIRPRFAGAPLYANDFKEKVKLGFTVTAPYPMHPVSSLFMMGVLNKYSAVPGGYHEKQNGFIVSQARKKLAKSIRVTSGGRSIPFTIEPQSDEGMNITLKEPATPITVTVSSPGLELSYQALQAIEHGRQATVQMFVHPSDEIGGGNEHGYFPRFKTRVRVLKAKPHHQRHRLHRHRHRRPSSS
jgi:hypothetical protein